MPFQGKKLGFCSGIALFKSHPLEERLQESEALFCKQTTHHLDLAFEGVIRNHVDGRSATTKAGIRGTVDHARDTAVEDSPRAHRAGFERYIQSTAVQAPVFELARGSPDGQNFGMGGGVPQHLDLVMALPYHHAILNDDATDGNFLLIESLFGFAERHAHEFFVVVRVIHH